jgi:hypothetical protein
MGDHSGISPYLIVIRGAIVSFDLWLPIPEKDIVKCRN